MINYGSSITSSLPKNFCNLPAISKCELCMTQLIQNNEESCEVSKCDHCGLKLCERCLKENYEARHLDKKTGESILSLLLPSKHYQSTERLDSNEAPKSESANQPNSYHLGKNVDLYNHYNSVKKEFKYYYNSSKEILEKLYLLNNAIKVEEFTINQLNSIKHQVNSKSCELIKQINQEKSEILEQIENAKKKCNIVLNEHKEFYEMAFEFKEELRRIIKTYKERKQEENCSLDDLLEMYQSVKSITQSLEENNHEKLMRIHDSFQIQYEEKPVFRNLIGKLSINLDNSSNKSTNNKTRHFRESNKIEFSNKIDFKQEKHDSSSSCSSRSTPSNQLSSSNLNSSNNQIESEITNSIVSLRKNSKPKTLSPLLKDNSRSLSLNDLLSDLNRTKEPSQSSINTDLPNSVENLLNFKTLKSSTNKASRILNTDKVKNGTTNVKEVIVYSNHPLDNQFKSSSSSSSRVSPSNLDQRLNNPNSQLINQHIANQFTCSYSGYNYNFLPNHLISSDQNVRSPPINQEQGFAEISTGNQTLHSIENQIDLRGFSLEYYLNKNVPKQRLEIDILPSHLSSSQNRLLIASSFGKIRLIDLFSYRIKKDEIKNIQINGICMPLYEEMDDEIAYAISNSQMNQSDDLLNIGNSVILATSKELKVLKKDDLVSNDDYLFNNPSGICFDEHKNLYICDSGNNRVKVLNSSLNLINVIETASSPDDKLSQPKSVAIYQNILFISDSANHRILSYLILNNGAQISFRNQVGLGYGEEPGMLRYPIECCVDKFGILYVRDHHNNRVQLFNQNSEFFHLIEVNSKHEMIYSMTVSENGDVYVAKMNQHRNHVQTVDKNEQQLLSASSNNKYYIDIY